MSLNNKFSIVLCLKNKTHNDNTNNIERFASIGMLTYNKFLDHDSVAEFIIVCPKDEQDLVESKIIKQFPDWPWKVYNDTHLLHPQVQASWARQQTVKLTVSQLVKTEHYLLIDDDTFMTKTFKYTDLFAEDRKLRFNKAQIDFPFFFLWSNQLLDYDFDRVQDAEYVMGITPEIFHTATVRNLVKYLVDRYGPQKFWQLKLQNNKFTEYGLYWIYLLKNDLVHQLYTKTDAPLYNHCITDNSQNLDIGIAKAFDDTSSHFFSFVQSSLKYPISKIQSLLKNTAKL